jgi:hypothetical protein
MLRILFIIPSLFSVALAGPVPLGQGPTASVVEESPGSTLVTALPRDGVQLPVEAQPLAILKIDWLNHEPAPKDFDVEVTDKERLITTTYRQGTIGITRTLLSTPDMIFLHFLADQPGAISFRTSLSSPREGNTIVQGRNELLWTSTRDPAVKAYARIIPFESDVETEGNSISLRGEGECMVIFGFTRKEDPSKPISGTWQRLAATFDPGEKHPDPVKIWHSILASKGAP